MQTYDRFIFESYNLHPEKSLIELHYSLDDQVKFTETLTVPDWLKFELPNDELDAALFALHLAGGASYYKLYLPKTIEIRSGHLSRSQADFWNELYTQGLGEFFYSNKIDFRDLINFPATRTDSPIHHPAAKPSTPERALVPFGGGKDSIVTTELLRSFKVNQTLLRVRSHPLITTLAHTARLPLLEVERTLDPQLAELNAGGAYNGHVPITAYISFLSIIIAILGGFDAVVFSNERSSSYGNIDYLGMTINHQWSKSLKFENSLKTYIAQFITPSVQYLNPLRPLSELKIAQLFARHPQYFEQATSCNRNWTLITQMNVNKRWCGTCPKCAFSFALFAAFLPESTVTAMFGENLFKNTKLLPLYRELWGEEGFKPFECVGTPEETQAALYLASKNPDYSESVVIKTFRASVLSDMEDPEHLTAELFTPEPAL